MPEQWILEELETVDLEDKRLNERFVTLLNREDPPGVETIWKGMQRMRDLAWGWETFGPAAQKTKRQKNVLYNESTGPGSLL